ncbi:MAG: monofunctional biosynthetic peptidoglycan transglycosylase [Chitinophagales bacterium]
MKKIISKVWRLFKRIFLVLFIFHLAYLLLVKWVNPPITFTQLGSLLSGHGLKRDYVSYQQISSNAKLAVIASEDQLFPDHNGFDFNSIEKAMKYNEKHPNRVRGASTISQQVAKNVFLWQGRSWFRKGMEVYFTFMIELLYSKQRILELYLNVAEMGNGIFGIESASHSYFSKPASKLSRSEAAMIAACLPNPKVYKVKPMGKWVARRYPWIVRQMNHLDGDPDIEHILK